MFGLTPEAVFAIIFILFTQIVFVLAILAIILLKKYTLWKQELHFEKSLADLNGRLEKGQISKQTYRTCRFDLEQLFRMYFMKK